MSKRRNAAPLHTVEEIAVAIKALSDPDERLRLLSLLPEILSGPERRYLLSVFPESHTSCTDISYSQESGLFELEWTETDAQHAPPDAITEADLLRLGSGNPLEGIAFANRRSEPLREKLKSFRNCEKARSEIPQKRNAEIDKALGVGIAEESIYKFMCSNCEELMRGRKKPFMTEKEMWRSYRYAKKNANEATKKHTLRVKNP
jgi:hypothetical protein